MARKVEKVVPFRRSYPWDEWLDGDVWELDPEDHTGTPQVFAMTARTEAIRRGGKLRTRVIGDRLTLQFTRG